MCVFVEGESERLTITMCSSNYCPIKNECFRAISYIDESQSLYNFEYECHEGNGFQMFINDFRKDKSELDG